MSMRAYQRLPESLPGLLRRRLEASPSRDAYRQFDAARGEWVSYSWEEVGTQVARWRQALRSEGFAHGARIGVLIPNSIEHVCADQSALSLGLVPVPMHVIDNPESLAYVLADSGASCLCVDSVERWQALAPLQDQLPELRRVVYVEGPPAGSQPGIARSLAEWLTSAQVSSAELRDVEPEPDDAAPSPEALAAIVYTSGTTGRPKGVMLSHRNIVANVQAILDLLPVAEEDVFLSFLPLSHTLERTIGYYLPLAAGAVVAFARSAALLMEDLATIRPTVLVSVPRIYERAYVALRASIERSRLRRALFNLTVRIGWQRFEHAQGRSAPPPWLTAALWPVLDRKVGAALRQRFGGRLRVAVTGGAPMSAHVAQPFLALGLPLLQGYGMTESAPVIACNTPDDNDPDSVGRPLPGIEVKIGEREELLVRGPNVMLGYWKRAAETAAVLDAEGWLHTGDRARIVEGRIRISGRIKDILVTSTGEKIPPADLESEILADPVFEQVMIIGEGRPYVAALAVLNAERWSREAARLGLDAKEPSALESRAARQWALERIRKAVRQFPSYAQPRTVALFAEPWTIAAGLITPTLKPKRAAIEARFSAKIAQLYAGH